MIKRFCDVCEKEGVEADLLFRQKLNDECHNLQQHISLDREFCYDCYLKVHDALATVIPNMPTPSLPADKAKR